jgi:hypothetical protein
MKKLVLLAAVLSSAVLLSACGGGGGGNESVVASADAQLAINPNTGPAVVSSMAGEAFSFGAGVPALGTNAATTVSLAAPAAAGGAPRFSVASGGNTASGTMGFGSCIFRVVTSTFPAGHELEEGAQVTVNPCNIRLSTQGAPADSVARERAAVFILGTAASAGTSVSVSISASGQVTVNGQVAGTVTIQPVTGS